MIEHYRFYGSMSSSFHLDFYAFLMKCWVAGPVLFHILTTWRRWCTRQNDDQRSRTMRLCVTTCALPGSSHGVRRAVHTRRCCDWRTCRSHVELSFCPFLVTFVLSLMKQRCPKYWWKKWRLYRWARSKKASVRTAFRASCWWTNKKTCR